MNVPDRLPSYDDIRFDGKGRLWVRTIGDEMATVHPGMARIFPDAGPSHRMWAVFDTSGTLLCEAELPSRFAPRVFLSRIYGLLELESGEIAVAAAQRPTCPGR